MAKSNVSVFVRIEIRVLRGLVNAVNRLAAIPVENAKKRIRALLDQEAEAQAAHTRYLNDVEALRKERIQAAEKSAQAQVKKSQERVQSTVGKCAKKSAAEAAKLRELERELSK